MWLPPVMLSALSLSRLASLWPRGVPRLWLVGPGRYSIMATHWRELTWDEAAARPLTPQPRRGDAPPFARGLLGLLSYDQFARGADSDGASGEQEGAPPRIFQVEAALVYDRERSLLYVPERRLPRPGDTTVDAGALAQGLCGAEGAVPEQSAPPLTLLAETSTEAYCESVQRVLSDIRAGRYYQLNLLRYFRCAETASALSDAWLARRLEASGGAFAAWFELPDLQLVSFSPERFVRLTPEPSGMRAEAFPIKGTAPRCAADARADAAAAASLKTSRKDGAELHMIVDLMRNDLQRVSQTGSVQVPSGGHLLSVRHVHHLEAHVSSRLALPLKFGAFLTALCPGGSITGAPKREVCAAIREYEGRARGYFMGHAFYLDESGAFDSSLLIRTLVRRGTGPYEFAAGSGLVIGSDPASEAREIAAKCGVLTAPEGPEPAITSP